MLPERGSFSEGSKVVGPPRDSGSHPPPRHWSGSCPGCLQQQKASSYIAQYPVLRTIQRTLHFTPWQTCSIRHHHNVSGKHASSHMLQLMGQGCSYTYPPLSIARYSFIQLSKLEQCRVKKLAQGLNTAAQDLNPGSHRT